MHGLSPAFRNEIVAEHAGFQSALIPIERRAPGILVVHRLAPRAVVPDDLQLAEIERGGLRVGDVRLTRLVHQNAAG